MVKAGYYDPSAAEDMQLQTYSHISQLIVLGSQAYMEKDCTTYLDSLLAIYRMVRSRFPPEKAAGFWKRLRELRDTLALEGSRDPSEQSELLDEIYELDMELHDVLASQGISLRTYADTGSIVTR